MHQLDRFLHKAPNLLSALSFIIVLGVLTWLSLRAIAFYFQLRGGQLLNLAITTQRERTLGGIACAQDPLESEQARRQLDQAILVLKSSTRYNRSASHPYLLLGRSFCLLGEPQAALAAYHAYVERRPENPLGHLELGFAYMKVCQGDLSSEVDFTNAPSKDGFCKNQAVQDLILEEWRKAGVLVGQFIAEGNRAFARQSYTVAARWYEYATVYSGQPDPSLQFRRSLLAVLSGRPAPVIGSPGDITVHLLADTLQIEAEDLRWIREDSHWGLHFGDRLSDHPSNDPTVGVMWWPGQAVAFVQAPEQAVYRIVIRALDTPPGPIRLQIERDMLAIDQLVLNTGDNTWKELETATVLSSGIHMIGIHFLEDRGDAVIDWIRFEIKH